MRRLIRLVNLRRPAGDDRGAVAVLVAVLLGAGVLLGFTALAIDVGKIYVERAELQNGADAGALAVAKSCALTATCETDSADTYANDNAKDDASNVDLVCGVGEGLSACPASGGKLVECPVETPDGNYAEVRTSTLTDGGSTLLPPSFAHSLTGNEDYEGTAVGACARASWGAPASAHTFAATISLCEWWVATGGTPDGPPTDPDYAPPPPYGPGEPEARYDGVMKLHTTVKKDTTCPGGPAGSDGPGMFGWVSGDGTCSVDIEDDWYDTDPGTDFPSDCEAVLADAWEKRTPLYVPVYDDTDSESGNNGSYHLEGFAAFIVTGYHLTGDPKRNRSDWLVPANDCKGNERCINGFFTQGLVPGGGTIGGPEMGVSIVKLTG